MRGDREFVVRCACLLLVLAACAAAAVDAAAKPFRARGLSDANRLETLVLRQINSLRQEHGLRPLRLSSKLGSAADQHSKEMALAGYFSHSSHDGTTFDRRVRRYYPPKGRLNVVGENLLWASPAIGPTGALRLWLGSPGHRRNLLDPRWREIGLSAVHADAAPGYFHGLEVTIVTADFGVRA